MITKEEWIERYAQRMFSEGGMLLEQAREVATEAYDNPDRYDSPEDDADEEMSYWANDE